MPNNNSVSQAAALAAFNGINKKDDSMFNIPLRNGSTLNVSRQAYITTRGSRPGSVSHPKLQLDKLNIPGDKKIISSPSTPMSSTARSPNEDPSKSQAKIREPQSAQYTPGNDYFGLKANGDTNRVAMARSKSAKDMINNVKNSIESYNTPVDTSRRRISQNHEPQEMLKNVRNSINSKAVSRQSVELNSRNLAMINAIRDLIDLKKISNSTNASSAALNSADDSKLQSTSFDNDLNLSLANKRLDSRNNSVSSLESAFLELGVAKESPVPDIIVDNHGRRASHTSLENSVYGGESPDNSYENEISGDDDLSSGNYDNLKQPTLYPEYSQGSTSSASMDSSAEDAVITMYESESADNDPKVESIQKAKPKRKPPPTINNENDDEIDLNPQKDSRYSMSEDVSSVDGEILETDIMANRRASVDSFNNVPASRKLPQFPDLYDKSKSEKHPLFRRYLKMKSSEKMPITTLPPQEIEPVTEGKVYMDLLTPSRLSTPHLHQPVQLKTTMRKTNKKKEKKMKFNEYKPWKNHVELSQITEQERKRYEGVWASNRGAYIDRVVTKLAGVDYNSENSKELLSNEHEISIRAALLSANASKLDASKLSDQLKFHNIESAEKSQLLHGILVRRTWQRSRLPNETLEAIWNLVDFRRDGTLNKPEFLVGMWLIDQCLYGRKLPKRVDDVVWDSLGYIGVNVVIKKSSRR